MNVNILAFWVAIVMFVMGNIRGINPKAKKMQACEHE